MSSRRRAPRKWDGRSWQARFAKDMREQLVAQLGKSPCATQETLIGLAVSTALDIEIMERNRTVEAGRSLHDHRVVLAYRNTLRRTMQALGLPEEQPASLLGTLPPNSATRAAHAMRDAA
jgi:hypothetical protein